MQKKIKLVLTAVFLVLIFSVITYAETKSSASLVMGTEVGNLAPEFTLPDLNGKMVSLSQFRGSKVFIYDWSSWCVCREELPFIEEYFKKYPKVKVITVAFDSEAQKRVMPIVKKYNFTLPVLIDQNHFLSRIYKFKATMNGFLIDESGVIIFKELDKFDIRIKETQATLKKLIETKSSAKTKKEKGKTLEEKLKEIEQQVAKDSANFDLHLNLGYLYSLTKQYDKAIAQYDAAIKIDPKPADVYYRLGVVYYNQGNIKMTLKNWKEALKREPGNYLYYRSYNALRSPKEYYKDEEG